MTSSNYSVPCTKTKFGNRAFSAVGPVIWNSIQEAETVSSFKCKLKTRLFNMF